jgi:hypothetical protein
MEREAYETQEQRIAYTLPASEPVEAYFKKPVTV